MKNLVSVLMIFMLFAAASCKKKAPEKDTTYNWFFDIQERMHPAVTILPKKWRLTMVSSLLWRYV